MKKTKVSILISMLFSALPFYAKASPNCIFNGVSSTCPSVTDNSGTPLTPPDTQSIVEKRNGSLVINGNNATLTGGTLTNSSIADSNGYTSFIGVGWTGTAPNATTGTVVNNRVEVNNLNLNVTQGNGASRGVQTFLNDQKISGVTSINDYANFNNENSGSLSTLINSSNITLKTTGNVAAGNTIGISSEAYGSGQEHEIKMTSQTTNNQFEISSTNGDAIGIFSGSAVSADISYNSSITASTAATFGAKSIDIDIQKSDISVHSDDARAVGIMTDYVQNDGTNLITVDSASSIQVSSHSTNVQKYATGILANTNSLGSNAKTSIDSGATIIVNANDANAYGIRSHSFENKIISSGDIAVTSTHANATGIFSSGTLLANTDARPNGFENRYGKNQHIENSGKITITANSTAKAIDVEGYEGDISVVNHGELLLTGDANTTGINLVTGKIFNGDTYTNLADNILVANTSTISVNSDNNHVGNGIVVEAINGSQNEIVINNSGTITASTAIKASSTSNEGIRLDNTGDLYGNIDFSSDGNYTINQIKGTITNVDNTVGDIIIGTGNANYHMIGGILNNNLYMGDGYNEAIIDTNATVNNNLQLNGGATQSTDSSTLTFKGQDINIFTDTANDNKGINLISWDKVTLESTNATLVGDLFATTKHSLLTIDNNSTLYVANAGTTNITGDITNNGILDLVKDKDQTNPSLISELVITGNYTGDMTSNGKADTSTLIVNTIWNENPATSYSDSLHITGTASGYTEVKVKNEIIGDIVSDKVNATDKYSNTVITVDNHSLGANSFYGFANTTGKELALLVQTDANNYAWKLSGSQGINPKVPEAVLMPKANLNAGYSILSTLHERVSEQQTMAWDDCATCQVTHHDGQVWGRFIGNYNKTEGKSQFDYSSKLWGIQLGYDLNIDYDADSNTRSHTGLMFTYAKDNLNFYNSKDIYFNTDTGNYAEKNTRTGHGQADIYSLGGYHTYYDENGRYLDFVGMFNYIQNKYTTYNESNDKNHAYGMIFSTEAGRPFALSNNGLNHGDWLIEPQAQLTYQFLKYSHYNTENDIHVDQNNQQGLRGRVGIRLAYNQGTDELKTKTVYFTGNIIHDFLNQKSIDFGTSTVDEKFAKTTGELGLGLQLPLSNTSYVYFDTRYYHSLGSSNGKTKEFSGTLGLKYHW